jgi:hypothetical protein
MANQFRDTAGGQLLSGLRDNVLELEMQRDGWLIIEMDD